MPALLVIEAINATPIVTESQVVRYRWHPRFEREVWIHCTRVREGIGVVRCGLTADLDLRAVEVPLWMFDGGVCGVMPLTVTPAVCVESLLDLKTLLAIVRGGTSPLLQAEHPDPISSGGAHAGLAPSQPPHQTVIAVRAVETSTELGVDPCRRAAADPAAVGSPVTRTRRQDLRCRRGGGQS
jgi:hypothetical protein